MTPINKRRCDKCALANKNNGVCNLTQLPIDLEKDQCSKFNDEPIHCVICRSITLHPIIECLNDNYYHLCPQCSDKVGTCATCLHNSPKCRFQTDQSALPLYTVVQERQGNAIIQKQVLNPERQKVTCALGCDCWDTDQKRCRKEYENCENYLFNSSLLSVISSENSF